MKNRKLYICFINNGARYVLWAMNDEFYNSVYDYNVTGFEKFNIILKQYGLECKVLTDNRPNYYEVIDEQLFGLFLLEFSDQLDIKTV